VTITIEQMDNIYIELLQKDSLLAESKISRSKEFLLHRALDSTQKNVKLLKTELNSLSERYDVVLTSNQRQKYKLKKTRAYLLSAIGVVILQAIIGVQ